MATIETLNFPIATLTLGMTWSPVVTNLLVGGFLIVSLAMILLVLIQRPQGGGLSGAFGAGGGGGAGQTAFGTKTGDVLTYATITIFLLFLLFAIVLNFATRPQTSPSNIPAISTPADEPDTGTSTGIGDDQPMGEESQADEVLPSDTPADSAPEDAAEDAGQELPADQPPADPSDAETDE